MNDSLIIEYLKFMFSQVQLQQEVRDRWFRYYLLIMSAFLTLILASIKWIDKINSSEYLPLFISIISFLALIIGLMFFMIYLHQRRNYLKTYKLMDIADKIINSKIADSSPNNNSKKNKSNWQPKKGADYYTLCIYTIINTIYIISSIYFILFFYKINIDTILCATIFSALALIMSSYILKKKHFYL